MARQQTRKLVGGYRLRADGLRYLWADGEGRREDVDYEDGFRVTIDVVSADDGVAVLRLRHQAAGGLSTMDYIVSLVSTELHYGGHRWWFLCPEAGRRVAHLYLPFDSAEFKSRIAYNLHYASQRDGRVDRTASRARRLHRQLGGDGLALGQSVRSLPAKKKGRWRATHEKQIVRWKRADEAACAAWIASVQKLLHGRNNGSGVA
jgi:hypothetical protein